MLEHFTIGNNGNLLIGYFVIDALVKHQLLKFQ